MPNFLVFQLKAPLASFGSTVGVYRATDTRPRRSAVLGLVAAAIGIERSESARFAALSRDVRVATLAVRQPTVLVDFHTVQAPAKLLGQTRREQLATGQPNCIPTRREYLQDGHWVIVLEGEQALLQECERALEQPVFPLYVGRKSCVLSAHVAGRVIESTSAEAAVKQWVARMSDKGPDAVRLPAAPALYWDEGMSVEGDAQVRHLRNDQRTSLAHPFFAPRLEFEGTLC